MNVLFDHNVPHKLRHSLPHHQVTTADEMGWAELENGMLLAAAEQAGFDLIVTADQNLSYQQNLTGRKLAVVVLSTNRWKILKEATLKIEQAITAAVPGSFEYVTFDLPPRDPRTSS